MIYIIIPVYNRWHFTRECLNRLGQQNYQNFKIVVVNDGSTDETSLELAQKYPLVKELKGDGSLWWTGSINLGIKYALEEGAEFILSLNNDTLPSKDYLNSLIKAYRIAPNSLIGSTGIDESNGSINYCGERIHWLTDKGKSLKSEIDESISNQLLPVSYFPGRGLFIPRIVFEKIGVFDQKKFPHYLADYDFTIRAAKAGFPIYCSVDAKITTYPEASGANQLMTKKNLKNYKEHLFGMKGAANLKFYFTYAIRHCPWYILPISLSIGTTKRLVSYWLK